MREQEAVGLLRRLRVVWEAPGQPAKLNPKALIVAAQTPILQGSNHFLLLNSQGMASEDHSCVR